MPEELLVTSGMRKIWRTRDSCHACSLFLLFLLLLLLRHLLLFNVHVHFDRIYLRPFISNSTVTRVAQHKLSRTVSDVLFFVVKDL